MAPSTHEEELEIETCKRELRALGFYLRYTEWPLGHQVVLHTRGDTSHHLVTEWHRSELDAWQAALRLALLEVPGWGDSPAPN